MVKPSIKSTEGQSVLAVVIGGLVMMYSIISGDNSSGIPIDEILKHAKTAQEIVEAYKLDSVSNGGWDSMKIGLILTFVYKVLGKFTESRTSLKMKELEVPTDEALNKNR